MIFIDKVKNTPPRKSKKGFTLSEILIVLTILGVVSSILIPNLITNISDYSNQQALKVVFSEISDATQRMQNDNGGVLWTITGGGQDTTDGASMFAGYAKYLNFVSTGNDGCGAYTGSFFAPQYYEYLSCYL